MKDPETIGTALTTAVMVRRSLTFQKGCGMIPPPALQIVAGSLREGAARVRYSQSHHGKPGRACQAMEPAMSRISRSLLRTITMAISSVRRAVAQMGSE